MNIKAFIRSVIAPLYWWYVNRKNSMSIEEPSISFRLRIGKYAFIRKGSEVGPSVIMGDYSYISGPRSYVEDAEIGKFCSIARQVTIGVSGHNYNWVTTSPIITSAAYDISDVNINEPQRSKPIIGNDVWIGMNSIVMRGVVVGDGAVIAAGAVVAKNVAPYSIVGGNPAHHIKYRFSEDQIRDLLNIKWWNWSVEKIRENIHLMYDIDQFIKQHKI